MRKTLLIILLLTSLILSGCFHPTRVLYPDSPILIQDVKSGLFSAYVNVYAYDKTTNTMKLYGWMDINDLKGYTITKYDWNNYIGEHE